jgi:uncharacterized membrane protein YedE/YeeE
MNELKTVWWKYPAWLLFGVYFGAVLTKAQVISVVRVRRMFAFQEPHMYLVIGSAVVTGVISMLIVKALRKSKTDVSGQPMEFKKRPFQPGIVGGGLIFGVGWYFTASCPGPIYALIGTGTWTAFVILGGALVGALLYALVRPKLPH